MPVHPHLADQPDVRLAEDCTASVHPLAGPLPAKDALELGREPGAGRVDLARGETDLRLAERHVEPPAPDPRRCPGSARKTGSRRRRRSARRPTSGGRCSVWTTPCRRCRSMSGPARGYPALAPAPRSGEVHRSTCSSTYTFSEHSAPCSWPHWRPWRPERRPRARRLGPTLRVAAWRTGALGTAAVRFRPADSVSPGSRPPLARFAPGGRSQPAARRPDPGGPVRDPRGARVGRRSTFRA